MNELLAVVVPRQEVMAFSLRTQIVETNRERDRLPSLKVPVDTTKILPASLLALIGKLAAAGAFGSLMIYTPEHYPTVLRSTEINMCSAAASVASMIAPFAVNVGSIDSSLPY